MLRRRLMVSMAIGLLAGVLCTRYQIQWHRGGGDVYYATRLILDLLADRDPYAYTDTPSAYPLTAGLVTAPLALFSPEVGAGLFFGISSALLAFGLTRDQQWWRLLIFLVWPYWQALITVQWSPLLMGVALFPALLPLTLAKPHIGLPIALTYITWRRALACVVFGLISLVLLPNWPLRWLLHQGAPEQYIPPLFRLPLGPLLLVALLCWREERARFLLLFSAMPQRLFYDVFVLWLLPQSCRQLLSLVGLSWLLQIAFFFYPQLAEHWVLLLVYLPTLGFVLWPWLRQHWNAGMSRPEQRPKTFHT